MGMNINMTQFPLSRPKIWFLYESPSANIMNLVGSTGPAGVPDGF
jgi:hypothetical protein